jgi:hypothetical protein
VAEDESVLLLLLLMWSVRFGCGARNSARLLWSFRGLAVLVEEQIDRDGFVRSEGAREKGVGRV